MRLFEIPGTDGARMRFHDLPGAGRPLLFVHGLGCAGSSDYPRVAMSPALASRRRLVVDLPGAGFSDAPAAFGYTVSDHARALGALLESLGLDTLDVYGHSMGGAIAIELAAARPTLVRALVLSEPNLDAGGGSFSRPIAAMSEREYVARGHMTMASEALATGDPVWAASLRVSAPHAIHRAAVSLVRGGSPPWRDTLATLPMPRTIVFGARSLPTPDSEWMPAHGVRVAIVPDAGHSMAWEAPEGLARAVAKGCE